MGAATFPSARSALAMIGERYPAPPSRTCMPGCGEGETSRPEPLVQPDITVPDRSSPASVTPHASCCYPGTRREVEDSGHLGTPWGAQMSTIILPRRNTAHFLLLSDRWAIT